MMNWCRLLALVLVFYSHSTYAQSLIEEKISRTKIILTAQDPALSVRSLRRQLASSSTRVTVKRVGPLFPEFCALAQKNKVEPETLHLALLNQSISSLQASGARLDTLKEYLNDPATEFCNQFVITLRRTSLRRAAKSLSKLRIDGTQIRSIQPVYEYSVKKSDIAKVTDAKRLPSVPQGVISSPELNKRFFGLRWRNLAETPADRIDNEANGFVDDLFGINSGESNDSTSKSVREGFATLSVATDVNDTIRYTTIDAANALLYAIHTGLERALIPFGVNDYVVRDLANAALKAGTVVARSVEDLDPFNARVTSQINFGTNSSEPGVGCLFNNGGCCTSSEILVKRCVLTARHCLGSNMLYSNESVIYNGSEGVKYIRFDAIPPSSSMTPGAEEGFTDLAVVHFSRNRYKLLTGEHVCSNCGYSWRPKQLGTAAKNDNVKIVGYSSQDIQSTPTPNVTPSSIYYKKREGTFKVTESTTVNSGGNPYQLLKLNATGMGRINNGDSGGPVIKGANVVGVISMKQVIGWGNPFAPTVSAVNTPASVAIAAGMSFYQRSWVKSAADRICRLNGSMAIEVYPPHIGPVTIKMTSKDPYGDPLYIGTRTCDNNLHCSRDFIQLSVDITTPPSWTFDHYESAPNYPGGNITRPCVCPPGDEACPVNVATLPESYENFPGTIMSLCRAVYIQTSRSSSSSPSSSSSSSSRMSSRSPSSSSSASSLSRYSSIRSSSSLSASSMP